MTNLEEFLKQNGWLVYSNKGTSMMPLLRENRDLMVIEKKGPERCRRLDAVLFKKHGPEGRPVYVLHRILRVNDDGTYWVAGDNCTSGETVGEEQILGVLTSIIRDGKTVPITNRLYRLYSGTWCRCYRFRFLVLRIRNLAVRCIKRLK